MWFVERRSQQLRPSVIQRSDDSDKCTENNVERSGSTVLELPGGTEKNYEKPRDGGCVGVCCIYLYVQQHRNDSQKVKKMRARLNKVAAH